MGNNKQAIRVTKEDAIIIVASAIIGTTYSHLECELLFISFMHASRSAHLIPGGNTRGTTCILQYNYVCIVSPGNLQDSICVLIPVLTGNLYRHAGHVCIDDWQPAYVYIGRVCVLMSVLTGNLYICVLMSVLTGNLYRQGVCIDVSPDRQPV